MNFRRKLNDRKGFTLAEMLLAILILLLVSTIVANGIPVARNAYQKVVMAANAQDMMATAVSALRDELGTAWDIRVDDIQGNLNSGQFVTYYSAATGARSKIYKSANTEIKVQENVGLTELGVTNNDESESRFLATDKEDADSPSHLFVSYIGVQYSNGKVTFTGLKAGTASIRDLATVDSLSIEVFSDHEGE